MGDAPSKPAIRNSSRVRLPDGSRCCTCGVSNFVQTLLIHPTLADVTEKSSDGLELAGNKIARPGGTKNVLKMPPGFTYAAK
jgi:hypothetical protein